MTLRAGGHHDLDPDRGDRCIVVSALGRLQRVVEPQFRLLRPCVLVVDACLDEEGFREQSRLRGERVHQRRHEARGLVGLADILQRGGTVEDHAGVLADGSVGDAQRRNDRRGRTTGRIAQPADRFLRARDRHRVGGLEDVHGQAAKLAPATIEAARGDGIVGRARLLASGRPARGIVVEGGPDVRCDFGVADLRDRRDVGVRHADGAARLAAWDELDKHGTRRDDDGPPPASQIALRRRTAGSLARASTSACIDGNRSLGSRARPRRTTRQIQGGILDGTASPTGRTPSSSS